MPEPKQTEMGLKASCTAIFICMLFGGNASAIKISLVGIGAFTAAGSRFAAASLVILCWAAVNRVQLSISTRQVCQTLILAAIFVVQLSLFYHGLEKTTASHGVLIANMLPFFVLILAHFFIPSDRITLKKTVGILLGFAGVLFLFFDAPDMAYDAKTGDVMVLSAVVLWSISAVYVKRINSHYNFIQITLYPMMFSVPFFFLAGFLWDSPMVAHLNKGILVAMSYQALVTAGFGFLVWNSLLQRYGATALHSFLFIMPPFGVLFGVIFLGEPVTPNLLASILFIVFGVMVVNYRRKSLPWL